MPFRNATCICTPLKSRMDPNDGRGKMRTSFPLITRVGLVSAMLLVVGCMFGDLKKEIQEEKITYSLFGRVEGISRTESDVFVLLYAKTDNGLQFDRYTLPVDTNTYSFIVTPGTYWVVGFKDQNRNQRHDPGEPVGAWGRPDEIIVTGEVKTEASKEALDDLDIRLAPGPFPLAGVAVTVEDFTLMSSSLYKLGQVASWSDPVFDDNHGSTGFWKPMTFLRDQGVGIYFMSPYDPQKIPILFVHGAAGTPRAWEPMAASLDLNRFQPWVFYYPSGLRLDQISTALNVMVQRLQADYGFERMGVVAHSMGGLVSRSFILKHMIIDGLGTVQVFVSISTPWGGVPMAAEGVKNAPEAIPSWHDVVPKSKFIQQVFDDTLSPQVPHYLLFGYQGKCSMFMANNDGTVEVSSQLDLRAQKDAKDVRGLNEDHMSILASKEAISYLNQALEASFPEKD